ncbi:hypothetical protein [Novipirellula caenicola]|uniref:Leucine Rich repeats (2 copies) n=1 Tax=Novipirellula caenicola TaxID=1536901 RepID=A0ABP9VIW1_9BACT
MAQESTDESDPRNAAVDGTAKDAANLDSGSGDAAEASAKFRGQRWAIGVTILVVAIAYAGYRWTQSNPTSAQSQHVEPSPQEKFDQIHEPLVQGKATALEIDDFEITDSMLLQVKDLEAVETLIVDQGRVTDEGIAHLPTLPNLQLVRLRYSPITDAGMATLAKCSSLWYVNLPHAECTAKGVQLLKAIPELRQLRIASPKLGNEVTREIASIQSLRGVHLIDVPVTNDGLKSLASLPYLESLYLDNSLVTESGWRWLYTNYPQIHVHVNQEHHDYDPKAHVHHD